MQHIVQFVLGLKGILSEVELHYIRARLRGGIINKARRGELASPLPVGLVYDDQDRVQLDSDTQVQDAVKLLFATFRRTGTARATLKYFREQKVLFPRRLTTGLRKGELVWGEVCHARILQVLHNPRYAGAFCFGRTKVRVSAAGKVQYRQKDRKDWIALIPNAHPGYITWEEFEDTQKRLLVNGQAEGEDRRKSPPGEGPALLQGLVVCGVCGRRMTVRYHQRKGKLYPIYECQRTAIELTEPRCQCMPGHAIDQAIAKLVLDTMTPVSMELALAVQQEIHTRQQEAQQLRAKQVERLRYESELARQRYMRCDPANRLVASSLEADWNQSLRKLQEAQAEFEQQCNHDALQLTDDIRQRVMALTNDFSAVWHSPQTSDRDRKRVTRLLIDDVTLLRTEQGLTLNIRFRGGSTQTIALSAPQTSWQSWTTRPEVITQIDTLLNDYTDQQTADVLNAQGARSGQGRLFSAAIIARLRREYGLQDRFTRLRARGFLTLEEAATRLGVSTGTVKIWRRRGFIRSHAYTNQLECLYELPADEALPTKQQGRKIVDRSPITQFIPIRSKEVHPDA